MLRTAIENGYADYKHMQEDADLDPSRDLPAFVEIMKAGHLDRSYAAVWTGDVRFEAIPLFGLDPDRSPPALPGTGVQGYRMVALTVARTSPEGPPIAASVWHRPVITEETKDQLAERQARAAVALLRMGKADEVMPLLRHSADPRLRSFIVNWLKPLGADPNTLAAELDRLPPTAKPTPAQGQQFMDAVLFHPETSQRRALILALGTYGTEGLSPGEREPLTGKLLDLYRNDPDAGIHGAAEWTLRQWKQQEKLKELDAELMKLKDRGDRRWYVNSQGQTFAVIEGPVEFRMGSPPTEPERFAENETPHRRIIPRRFAIAAKEVTVEQYQEFVKENPGRSIIADNDRYSPDPKGPMNRRHLVSCRRLLQLAEPRRRTCRNVLRAERAGPVCRGDEDPRRRPATDGLPAAHRGGMGVRLPGGGGDQPILRVESWTCWGVCMVSCQRHRTGPGRAAACCPTTWGCSTCWGTCMNGVRTGLAYQTGRTEYIMMI